jgi:hypothetical protein
MEVVALQQPQNLPQLTGTGKSKDENKQRECSKMERQRVKIKKGETGNKQQNCENKKNEKSGGKVNFVQRY